MARLAGFPARRAGNLGGAFLAVGQKQSLGLAENLLFEATAGGVSLTANGIATAAPTVGNPAISQGHALAATGATASPAVATPALAQVHSLAASGVATGSPTVASPAVGQNHAATATSAATASPTVASPALSQAHSLQAAGVATGQPVVGSPPLSAAGAMSAVGVETGPPVVGQPPVAQVHALAAVGVIASPVVGQPALDGAAPQYSAGASVSYRRLRDEGLTAVLPTQQAVNVTLKVPTVSLGSPVVGWPALTEEFDPQAMDEDMIMIAA